MVGEIAPRETLLDRLVLVVYMESMELVAEEQAHKMVDLVAEPQAQFL
jgi:hypothetical protein